MQNTSSGGVTINDVVMHITRLHINQSINQSVINHSVDKSNK